MEPIPPLWPRPRFQAGGGNAMVFYALYGTFPKTIQVSGEKYRTAGVPKGVRIKKVTREDKTDFPFTGAGISRLLQPQNPELAASVQSAPECLIITGEVEDPPDLNYLRDAIGLATYFVEEGDNVLIDPQKLGLYSKDSWRKEIFEPDPPRLLNHTVIMVSPEPLGTKWIHTRGLKKIRAAGHQHSGVSLVYEDAFIDLCNRLIILQAEGALIPEGDQIRLEKIPVAQLSCHHGGDPDDPDFNNVHL